VVRHLQHVHATREPLERSLLGADFRVTQEQHPHAWPLDQKHDALIVRFETALPARRAQHRYAPPADGQSHARRKPLHRDAAHRAGGARLPGRIAAGGAAGLRLGRRHADPAHRRDGRKAGQPAGVVGVVVCEHETVDPPQARPGQRPLDRERVGTAVDEERSRPVLHEHGVALAHVEDDDPRSSARRTRARRERQSDRQGRRAESDAHQSTGLRPSQPDGRPRGEPREKRRRRPCVAR
jgi:hypothetical protein